MQKCHFLRSIHIQFFVYRLQLTFLFLFLKFEGDENQFSGNFPNLTNSFVLNLRGSRLDHLTGFSKECGSLPRGPRFNIKRLSSISLSVHLLLEFVLDP